jgi:hypothetical protein
MSTRRTLNSSINSDHADFREDERMSANAAIAAGLSNGRTSGNDFFCAISTCAFARLSKQGSYPLVKSRLLQRAPRDVRSERTALLSNFAMRDPNI